MGRDCLESPSLAQVTPAGASRQGPKNSRIARTLRFLTSLSSRQPSAAVSSCFSLSSPRSLLAGARSALLFVAALASPTVSSRRGCPPSRALLSRSSVPVTTLHAAATLASPRQFAKAEVRRTPPIPGTKPPIPVTEPPPAPPPSPSMLTRITWVWYGSAPEVGSVPGIQIPGPPHLSGTMPGFTGGWSKSRMWLAVELRCATECDSHNGAGAGGSGQTAFTIAVISGMISN
mmetsp:Transcript_18432/g.46040  ORF Transcript_18432/g.46040 Transcript_18432/m.46040 type:complete len:232 (+) Transcript_18432:374-1069(+)